MAVTATAAAVQHSREGLQHYTIAAQSLASALVQLGAQSGTLVLAPTDLTAGKTVDSIDAQMTVDEALRRLLDNTGLKSVRGPDGSVTVVAQKSVASRQQGKALEGTGPGPAPEAQGSADGELQEVLVTATRRELPLSKTPISVTSYAQEELDLQGIKSITGLAEFTPGVTYRLDQVGLTYEIAIRGISSQVGAATTGIYVDDTPIQARSGIAENVYPILFDQERVEVLRGPQGTLFGSGAEGGAIRFITPDPGLQHYVGYARTEFASTDHGAPSYEAGAAVGGPIVEDRVGFRVSAYFREDGGYIDAVSPASGRVDRRNVNYTDTAALRGALKIALTDTLTITPSILYQRAHAGSDNLYWDVLSDKGAGQFRTGFDAPQPNQNAFTLAALKVEWHNDQIQLISNTSYFYNHQQRINDYTAFLDCLLWVATACTSPPSPPTAGYYALSLVENYQNSMTQEVRLQSSAPNTRLTWVVGGFFQRTRVGGGQKFMDPYLPQLSQQIYGGNVLQEFGENLVEGKYSYFLDRHVQDQQSAAFGQADFAVTSQLKLTAGLRIEHAQYSFNQSRDGPLTSPKHAAGAEGEHPATPKFGISYEYTDTGMVYVSAGKGFRVGGANNPIPNTTPTCLQTLSSVGLSSFPRAYKSDSLWSYEVGAKNRFAGNRAQLFASVYYIKWKDIQQSIALPGCGSNFIGNVGGVTSKGFDIGLQARVFERLLLSFQAAYTDAKFNSTVAFLDPSALPPIRSVIVAAGDSLGVAPWTGTFAAQYDYRLFQHSAYVRADYTYTSKENTRSPTMDPQVSTSFGYDPALLPPPSTSLLNLRAGVQLSGVDVSLFGNNVLNSEPDLTQVHDFPGETFFYKSTFRPRTVGISATYRF
jgi:outer membrane receptor protein involved in Fe transport